MEVLVFMVIAGRVSIVTDWRGQIMRWPCSAEMQTFSSKCSLTAHASGGLGGQVFDEQLPIVLRCGGLEGVDELGNLLPQGVARGGHHQETAPLQRQCPVGANQVQLGAKVGQGADALQFGIDLRSHFSRAVTHHACIVKAQGLECHDSRLQLRFGVEDDDSVPHGLEDAKAGGGCVLSIARSMDVSGLRQSPARD